MSLAVNGINIAVKDLAAATARYEKLFQVEGEHVGAEGFAFRAWKAPDSTSEDSSSA